MNQTNLNCANMNMRLETASVLVHKAIDEINQNKIRKGNLVWLELTGCSGNIISLLDGADPNFKNLATQMVNFIYDNSLMTAEGEFAMEKLFGVTGDDFILAVEGAVSTKDDGLYNVIGRMEGQPLTAYEAIKNFGEKAKYVIGVGTCASDGGISAARPNPAECVGIQSLLDKKVIKLPGCPCHPDWFLGTLGYILLFGEPALDDRNRPLMFYSTLIPPADRFLIKGILPQCLVRKPACSSWVAEGLSRGWTARSGSGTIGLTGPSETTRPASVARCLASRIGWNRLSATIRPDRSDLREKNCN